MDDKKFTVEDGLKIQQRELHMYKTILKADIYEQLENYVIGTNKNLKEGYLVFRGGMISEYVDTIMHEIWRKSRENSLPEEFKNLVILGNEITNRWKDSINQVSSIIGNGNLAISLRGAKLLELKQNRISKEAKDFIKIYEPKGKLVDFPKPIIAKMLEKQMEQSMFNHFVERFEYNPSFQGVQYGFDWDKTPEGYKFWELVINSKNFQLFFEKFPQSPQMESTIYDAIDNFLTTYEPKGDIAEYPKEIIAKMLEYQIFQTPLEQLVLQERIFYFEKQFDMPLEYGGFDWDKTIEGQYFWSDVTHDKNFDIFYEKYPEIKFGNTHLQKQGINR